MAESKDEREAGGNTVLLHPLALINISDHYTRVKVQGGIGGEAWAKRAAELAASHQDPDAAVGVVDAVTGEPRALGVLFGRHVGKTMHVHYSYEMKPGFEGEGSEARLVFDHTFLRAQLDLISQVYEGYEMLGWYSTGAAPTDDDMRLHKDLAAYNEAPLYLLLNPAVSSDAKELPISLYASQVVVADGLPRSVFVAQPYEVDAMESERITVDHVSKVTSQVPKGSSNLYRTMTGTIEAIKMLSERIDIMLAFLRATVDGRVRRNHALLRQIAGIVAMLPTMDGGAFDARLAGDYADTTLTTYLATLTKSAQALHEVVERVSVSNFGGRHGGGGGGGGGRGGRSMGRMDMGMGMGIGMGMGMGGGMYDM